MKTKAQLRRAFGRRLTQEMLSQGYVAPHNAAIKVNATLLKNHSGVKSLEMARRYIKGDAIPQNLKVIANICKWLNVREAWLLRGELPKTPQEQEQQKATFSVDSVVLKNCLDSVLEAAEKHNQKPSSDAISSIAAYLYLEYVNGEKKTPSTQISEMLRLRMFESK